VEAVGGIEVSLLAAELRRRGQLDAIGSFRKLGSVSDEVLPAVSGKREHHSRYYIKIAADDVRSAMWKLKSNIPAMG
jgi:hypothetical protein